MDGPFVIRHHYDAGSQPAAVIPAPDLDVRRAAVHIQFKAEEWFGDDTILPNETIAKALIAFYGCRPAIAPEDAYSRDARGEGVVDLYWHRDHRWPGWEESDASIIDDPSLQREGLRDFLEPIRSYRQIG